MFLAFVGEFHDGEDENEHECAQQNISYMAEEVIVRAEAEQIRGPQSESGRQKGRYPFSACFCMRRLQHCP